MHKEKDNINVSLYIYRLNCNKSRQLTEMGGIKL